MIKQVSMTITGQVHGVGFRYATMEKARELLITGWVANTPEGTVHIVAQAEELILKELIDWCAVGPQNARVDNLDVQWQEPEGLFHDFEMRRY